jgi:acyl phosphate:glycerol-3-phosphate acyltransferase
VLPNLWVRTAAVETWNRITLCEPAEHFSLATISDTMLFIDLAVCLISSTRHGLTRVLGVTQKVPIIATGNMIENGLAVAVAYAIGSIPFAFLIGEYVGGIDIRTQGSGNVGATNVGRLLGAKWGFCALLCDCLKGLLPVLLLPTLICGSDAIASDVAVHLKISIGLAAIAGHMFPCWLKFRGGKGVATGLGVVIVVAPVASLIAVAVFAVTFVLSRFVSLGSILASITFAISQLLLMQPEPFAEGHWSLAGFSLILPTLIVYRHRSNITRLLQGTESPLKKKVATSEGDSKGEEE